MTQRELGAGYFLLRKSLLRKVFTMDREISSFDSVNESVQQTSPRSSSKRRASKEHHAKVVKKRALHSGDGKQPRKDCNHDSKSFCKINSLTVEDMVFNFNRIYDFKDKVEQDRELLMLVITTPVQRTRVSDESRQKKKDVSTTYRLLNKDTKTSVEVCRASFLSVLGNCPDVIYSLALYCDIVVSFYNMKNFMY